MSRVRSEPRFALADPIEKFTLQTYELIDRVTQTELNRLSEVQGIVHTCRKGCHHCCQMPIDTIYHEAYTLAKYVEKNYPDARKNRFIRRVQHWNHWFEEDGQIKLRGGADLDEVFDHAPFCPVLEKGECGAYPARPSTCRTYYVSSSPNACRAYEDPKYNHEERRILFSIQKRLAPLGHEIRQRIEQITEGPFEDSVKLLPQWLKAIME